MQDEVIFRYKNGKIIPIKVKKDISTNEYMNAKLRNKNNANNDDEKINKIPEKVINNFIEKNIIETNDTKGNFYITTISPDDFLQLTASKDTIKRIENRVNSGEYGTFNLNKLNKSYMMLEIDLRNGNVINHEGRHRMQMLKNNGYKKSEIIIYSLNNSYWYEDNPNKNMKHDFNSLHLKSQSKESDFTTTLTNLKYIKNKEV